MYPEHHQTTLEFQVPSLQQRDYLHNPGGDLKTVDITLPVDVNSVDRVIMFSVFTQLFQKDIEHYLRECARVLKDGGLVYTAMFAFDEAILQKAHETNIIRFEHEHADGCRIHSLDNPLGAVAYTEVHETASNGGMELAAPIHRGGWSGVMSNVIERQDVVILRKKATVKWRSFGHPLPELRKKCLYVRVTLSEVMRQWMLWARSY